MSNFNIVILLHFIINIDPINKIICYNVRVVLLYKTKYLRNYNGTDKHTFK